MFPHAGREEEAEEQGQTQEQEETINIVIDNIFEVIIKEIQRE